MTARHAVRSGAVRRRLLLCLFVAICALPGAAAASPALRDCDTPHQQRLAGADPVADTPCGGVRPGVQVEIPLEDGTSRCTLNFLFTSTDEEGRVTRYAGTAGHCALLAHATRQWDFPTGPVAFVTDTEAGQEEIGHVVYAALSDERDFALIQLANGVQADPQLCHWGGPTGVHTGNGASLDDPLTVRHFGRGTALGEITPARTAFATDLSHPRTVFLTGVATGGDSGSAVVLDSGEALGVLVALGGTRTPDPQRPGDTGVIKVQRLPYELAAAEDVLGVDLNLVTAPVLPRD